MQTISTRFHGPTNKQSGRVIARPSGAKNTERAAVLSAEFERIEDAHAEAARRLCAKMGWWGTWSGGDTKTGMVWVAVPDYNLVIPKPE